MLGASLLRVGVERGCVVRGCVVRGGVTRGWVARGWVARGRRVAPGRAPLAAPPVPLSHHTTAPGGALSRGGRTPLALIDAAASARMAVGEAVTNIAAAPIDKLGNIKLSANWMAAAGHPGEDARLFEAVETVGLELCPALGIAIPVGKDSLSMKTVWREGDKEKRMRAPVSLIISAFAPVADVHRSLTPLLDSDCGPSRLLLLDLGNTRNRLGGSSLAQVHDAFGGAVPDLDDPLQLKRFFEAIQALNRAGLIRAYHDRSDGGVIATLCEMAFAGRTGLNISLDGLGESDAGILFSEELGAVVQVCHRDTDEVLKVLQDAGLGHHSHVIGTLNDEDQIEVRRSSQLLLGASRIELQQAWSETTREMQALRDNPECADEEYARIDNTEDPGLSPYIAFDPDADITSFFINTGAKPKMAILREQGVNGQVEMAAAFSKAGFEAVDVHMSDILSGRLDLQSFKGIAACGGFSYGDVLGAGEGWAKSILYNRCAFDVFSEFFMRRDSFGLGICNGCQMMSNLHSIIPGADNWPHFVKNRSEQFEARVAMVEVLESPSIFLQSMQGSMMPIAVAHGEGRAEARGAEPMEDLACLRYIDRHAAATEVYPANPNGSPAGLTGFTSDDGRFTIMMPHPERVFRSIQNSWQAPDWGEDGPWMRMFRNARMWVD